MPIIDYSKQVKKYATGTLLGDQLSRNLVLRLAQRSSAPESVLDIGCGAGTLLQQLKDIFSNVNVTGVDPCQAFLDEAGKNVPNGRFLVGHAAELPVSDASFDMVFSTWAIHHCQDLEAAMSEIARVVKVGGEIIFCVFHPIHSFLHLHDEVHAKKRQTLDYWGADKFLNHLHYDVDVEEEHHAIDAYIGPAFLKHFDLLHFSEGKQETSPNVLNVNHPTFFLIKARKREKDNEEAVVPLVSGESLKGHSEPTASKYLPVEANPLPAIADNMTQLIGNTPLMRVDMDELNGELLVKLEYLNPMGSVKDRLIAVIDQALNDGRLKPGDTVIEATAGNTGIAFMAALASRGLKGKILLMEKFSDAKANALKLLGAEVIRVPNYENDQDVAKAMAEAEGAFHFGQFHNGLNPKIHETGTAEEIWQQCHGHVDVIVAGCGTGGTLMGLAKNLKNKNPNLKMVGVLPKGAKLLPDDEIGSWEIEGIGTPYSPPLCEVELIDEWIRVTDIEAFQMAHRMMVEFSVFCGSSAGANMAGALRSSIVADLDNDGRCLVILPDSSKNYPNTLSDYQWMREKGFLYQPE